MSILDIIKKRYAAKLFSGEKIRTSDIKKMKEAIRLAPSSFNLQPWKVKVVSDKETLKKLEKVSYNQLQISSASHLFVFCSIDSLEDNKNKLLQNAKDNWPKEKTSIFSGIINSAVSRMNKTEQKKLSEREIFLALENLLLVTTDLGYAACPVGGFEKDKYKKILSIPKNLDPVVICPVGIAKDKKRKKFRFNDKDIFF